MSVGTNGAEAGMVKTRGAGAGGIQRF